MHCFFNLSNGVETIVDREGVDVETAEEAHTEARSAMTEVVREDGCDAAVWVGWYIEVTSVTGAVICRIDLNEADD